MSKPATRIPVRLLRNPVHLLSLGFGTGLAPRAPGTFGTLAALPFYLLMHGLPTWVYALCCAGLFVVGVWLCGATARTLGVHDHPGIVWDEVVGYLLTLVAVPYDWRWLLLGFALFRLFDIWKPWPIRNVDRNLRGGLGIMMDDLLAAVYASIVMQVILHVLA